MAVKKRFGKEDGTIVYTIRKSDLYASGIEPTREILDIASENEKVDFALVLAKILRELTAQTGNILVYPDYVEIHLNNVPTNLLNPSQTKDEPALGGLHTFYIEKMCEKNATQNRTKKKGKYGYNILVKLHRKQQKKTKSRRKGQKETRAQDGLDSSKTGGAEGNRTPVRKQLGGNFSGRSLLFTFPHPGGNKHPTGISSFMMHGIGKTYLTHGLHSNHTLARHVDLPGRMGA